MEELARTYWPQILALIAFVAWLIRLEAIVKSDREAIGELRREHAELNRRAQDQAVTLARIDESLASIKITLDRLYSRVNGKG